MTGLRYGPRRHNGPARVVPGARTGPLWLRGPYRKATSWWSVFLAAAAAAAQQPQGPQHEQSGPGAIFA